MTSFRRAGFSGCTDSSVVNPAREVAAPETAVGSDPARRDSGRRPEARAGQLPLERSPSWRWMTPLPAAWRVR